MINSSDLLAAYDGELRTDAETPSAIAVVHLGPLRLVTFRGGRGFVTYQNLAGADTDTISRLVPEVLDHYRADPDIARVEWKTRGHDHAPGLHESLLENGFLPDEPESIMIGEARLLAVDVALPEEVTLRMVEMGLAHPSPGSRVIKWSVSSSLSADSGDGSETDM